MKKMPPVPPANRSPKGPGSAPKVPVDTTDDGVPEDREHEDRQGDIEQKTTNYPQTR
jgi:hypothetical protein